MILHTVGSLGERAGGPSRTVPSLCQALSDRGESEVRILTARSSEFGSNRTFENLTVVESDSHRQSAWETAICRLIDDGCHGASESRALLHDHGQWLPINRASARVARLRNIPRVVTPRGMLSPWAMNYRRWKKQAAWHWFGRRDAASATVLHATSDLEAAELRSLGLRNPIAVIPNGVDRPDWEFQNCHKKPQVVFLSRLHPKKGVVELVDVWRRLNTEGWQLLLAGPDEANMVSTLSLDNAANIRYLGPVEGESKWRLLSESSLFVLPSYSENFGVVVAEALTAGTPVITTRGTPWSCLETERCGWWINMDSDSLADTLRQCLSLPAHELDEMGHRGQIFAKQEFGWNGIAAEMANVYRWILGDGERPDCVEL